MLFNVCFSVEIYHAIIIFFNVFCYMFTFHFPFHMKLLIVYTSHFFIYSLILRWLRIHLKKKNLLVNTSFHLPWNKRMPHFVFLFVEVDCLASRYSFNSNSETDLNRLGPLAVAGVSGNGRHSMLSWTLTGTKEDRSREAKISCLVVSTIHPAFLLRRDQKHRRYSPYVHELVVLADGIYMKHWISKFNVPWMRFIYEILSYLY